MDLTTAAKPSGAGQFQVQFGPILNRVMEVGVVQRTVCSAGFCPRIAVPSGDSTVSHPTSYF